MQIKKVTKHETPDYKTFNTREAASRHISNQVGPRLDKILKDCPWILPAGFTLWLYDNGKLHELKDLLNNWL